MKNLIITLCVIAVSTLNAQTTNFFTTVTNLWYQGYKSNVLEIAEQRLSIDTNDIAGLILKFEFDLAFLELSSFSNSAQRVLAVGQTITTTNFAKIFPLYELSINHLLAFIPYYSTNQTALVVDKAKALIPYKSLPADIVIKALQDDGHFD